MTFSQPQLPDFSNQGYRVEKMLGRNKQGGRVTYLATALSPAQPVVIKQFQFAQTGAQWSDYDAHQRELGMLQQLSHPSIPAYLDAFETKAGFCLVQEYKDAPSLAEPRSFTEAEVKEVAIATLKVLIYLQQQTPPIIHRDLKPENILVDQNLQVYLVDFGLARLEGDDLAASSIVKGTLGFMPPEQLFNRPLTPASDLYGLGATLTCLLSRTPSAAIGQLMDETGRIKYKPLLPHLESGFSRWLGKMVAPKLEDRYASAAEALDALNVRHKPGVVKVVIALGGVAILSSAGFLWTNLRPASVPSLSGPLVRLRKTQSCVGCDLSGVNLKGTDLRSVDLTGANLQGADLRKADLRGAYLARANLTSAQIEGAILASTDLRGATMPDGSIHP
ncbi:Serine/threonine-protein kinase B [Acaryochloris thomasi RCC1774]|uniref:non-specific serine/threonine protein kinase n=1 Tax=Acaryochloris thomasi RCC1774 TaxID=1764569 RepID=A0A2W1JMP3_9CYAN|nr:serine/threonine-protein kinase [Acaryochloris thomasi]PZD74593.1 Serine/threonine-protein kinase B [Acaryochloris thomasi RCC1774]